MPALFPYPMALAAVDPSMPLRQDGRVVECVGESLRGKQAALGGMEG